MGKGREFTPTAQHSRGVGETNRQARKRKGKGGWRLAQSEMEERRNNYTTSVRGKFMAVNVSNGDADAAIAAIAAAAM